MKKIVLALMLLSASLFAVGIEITPFGGFQWNGSSDDFAWYEDYLVGSGGAWYSGSFEIDHTGNYGVFVNLDLPDGGSQIELHWTGTQTQSQWRSNSNLYPDKDFDLMSNYWHIGGLKYFTPEKRVRPFVDVTVGATAFSFGDNVDLSTQWFFSTSLGLGAKIMFTERIGVRLGGRFLMPLNFSGVGVSFGSGGSSASAYGYVPVLQGDVHGGLIIKLGGKKKKAKAAEKPTAVTPKPVEPAQPETRVEEVSPTEVHLITE
jgi:hypothetical protein